MSYRPEYRSRPVVSKEELDRNAARLLEAAIVRQEREDKLIKADRRAHWSLNGYEEYSRTERYNLTNYR